MVTLQHQLGPIESALPRPSFKAQSMFLKGFGLQGRAASRLASQYRQIPTPWDRANPEDPALCAPRGPLRASADLVYRSYSRIGNRLVNGDGSAEFILIEGNVRIGARTPRSSRLLMIILPPSHDLLVPWTLGRRSYPDILALQSAPTHLHVPTPSPKMSRRDRETACTTTSNLPRESTSS
jgi:hypothetical protein